jgi:hypothetical protein
LSCASQASNRITSQTFGKCSWVPVHVSRSNHIIIRWAGASGSSLIFAKSPYTQVLSFPGINSTARCLRACIIQHLLCGGLHCQTLDFVPFKLHHRHLASGPANSPTFPDQITSSYVGLLPLRAQSAPLSSFCRLRACDNSYDTSGPLGVLDRFEV